MPRVLTTFEAVCEALGGVTAAAGLIGRRASNLCQWRAKYGAFPASLYFVVNSELAPHGCEASVAVFRFEKPQRRRK